MTTSRSLSVRTRIVAAVTLLAALAMLAAGVTVFLLEAGRISQRTIDDADQEIAEFLTLVKDGRDPNTGEAFADSQALIRLYLTRNVPNPDEVLIGYRGPRATQYLLSERASQLIAEPDFTALVEQRLSTGGDSWHHSPSQGELFVAVQPVHDAQGDGALVVVGLMDRQHQELLHTMKTYALVSSLFLLLLALAAHWIAGRLLAPLRDLRTTTDEITAATDLGLRVPEPKGRDDVADLTRTINGMLERLERGFEAQQRFLDDAGHELKTPITILQGHLELLDATDPDEVERTRAMLLDESERMGRLVNDLILLAKARRPDFVRRRPLDVDTLLHDVLARATGLADRDWHVAAATGAQVLGDAQRLTQALLQICHNAVRHTQPGGSITLAAHCLAETVQLSVSDTGPGVPERDRERIFERFHRAAEPTPPAAGDDGIGLGLSIVAAITAAHAGTVHVEDTDPRADPGSRGARFVITLPIAETAPKGRPWPTS